MPIPAASYSAVCALLGGAAVAVGSPGVGNRNTSNDQSKPEKPQPISDEPALTGADQGAGASSGASAGAEASPAANDGEIDAHGHPWSADLHASTKGKTKDGLWRMKVGVSRPDPLPGFPKDSGAASADTGTSPATPAPSATSQTAPAPESGQPATSGGEEEDEFAAFRAAAATSEATDAAAAAAVPERQYSDADLGALCNQAAVKLGDPSPIKEIIASFTPEGQVAHSRNIPAERRAEFVKAVEDKAGIQFAG